MKLIIMAIASIIGVVLGTVIALYGTYYTCVIVDMVEGATLGNDLAVVGWIFCFFTVPAGMFGGDCLTVFFSQ